MLVLKIMTRLHGWFMAQISDGTDEHIKAKDFGFAIPISISIPISTTPGLVAAKTIALSPDRLQAKLPHTTRTQIWTLTCR